MVKSLPKIGDQIPVENFHVSKLNVRATEPFGESEEDKALIANLRQGKIIGPFKARPEGDGFGVIVGRRRFLAKKVLGTKFFVVGTDCIIEPINEEDARESSLVENLDILREDMDPITRARALSEIISKSPGGLRSTAARLGISPSTLSEWTKILSLTPKMQDAVSQGKLFFTDALEVARIKLGAEKQDELTEILENEGLEPFQKELSRIATTGSMKRGIPKGKYIILRTIFDKTYKPDLELFEKLTRLAENDHKDVDIYAKDVLREHIKSKGI